MAHGMKTIFLVNKLLVHQVIVSPAEKEFSTAADKVSQQQEQKNIKVKQSWLLLWLLQDLQLAEPCTCRPAPRGDGPPSKILLSMQLLLKS